MLNVYCKTDAVVVLVGFLNDKIFVFPSQNKNFPGIHFANIPLAFIDEQIIKNIEKVSGWVGINRFLSIRQDFSETIRLDDGTEATLYLATVSKGDFALPTDWKSFPELMQAMPKNKTRIAYIKALQVLTGASQADTKVVEM